MKIPSITVRAGVELRAPRIVARIYRILLVKFACLRPTALVGTVGNLFFSFVFWMEFACVYIYIYDMEVSMGFYKRYVC